MGAGAGLGVGAGVAVGVAVGDGFGGVEAGDAVGIELINVATSVPAAGVSMTAETTFGSGVSVTVGPSFVVTTIGVTVVVATLSPASVRMANVNAPDSFETMTLPLSSTRRLFRCPHGQHAI